MANPEEPQKSPAREILDDSRSKLEGQRLEAARFAENAEALLMHHINVLPDLDINKVEEIIQRAAEKGEDTSAFYILDYEAFYHSMRVLPGMGNDWLEKAQKGEQWFIAKVQLLLKQRYAEALQKLRENDPAGERLVDIQFFSRGWAITTSINELSLGAPERAQRLFEEDVELKSRFHVNGLLRTSLPYRSEQRRSRWGWPLRVIPSLILFNAYPETYQNEVVFDIPFLSARGVVVDVDAISRRIKQNSAWVDYVAQVGAADQGDYFDLPHPGYDADLQVEINGSEVRVKVILTIKEGAEEKVN